MTKRIINFIIIIQPKLIYSEIHIILDEEKRSLERENSTSVIAFIYRGINGVTWKSSREGSSLHTSHVWGPIQTPNNSNTYVLFCRDPFRATNK